MSITEVPMKFNRFDAIVGVGARGEIKIIYSFFVQAKSLRRKGYGTAALKEIAKINHDLGYDYPVVLIDILPKGASFWEHKGAVLSSDKTLGFIDVQKLGV